MAARASRLRVFTPSDDPSPAEPPPSAPPTGARRKGRGQAMATTRRPGVRVHNPLVPMRGTPIKAQAEGWQAECYDVVDQVPMIGYLVNLKANTGALGTLAAEEYALNPDTEKWEWRDTEDPSALAQLAELRCEIGGQAELMRRMFQHVEIAGRFLLTAIPEIDWNGESTGARYWEPYSVLELNVEPDKRTDPKNPQSGQGTGRARWSNGGTSRTRSDPPALSADETLILDCIRRSPRASDEADSPIKRLLPAARQLIWLHMAISAVARQRANGGVLAWPEEITDKDDDVSIDGDLAEIGDLAELATDASTDDGRIDPETRKVWRHLTAAIEDPDSAAAISPLVVIGPADFLDKIKRIEIAGSFDHLAELRQEVRAEIAMGYDAPSEKATGMGGIAGWGAYSVDMDWNRRHVVPIGNFLAEWLTAKLLRPALVAEHGKSWDDAVRFRFTYDGSALEARPDMSAAAKMAHEARAIGNRAFRNALGFNETDAPDDDERLQMLAEAMIKAAPIGAGPALATYVGFPPEIAQAFLDLAAAKSPAAANAAAGSDLTPGGDAPSEVTNVPTEPVPQGPDSTPDVPTGTGETTSASLILVGIAYQAGQRIAEVVGARVASRLDRLGTDGAGVRARLSGPKATWYAQLDDRERERLGMADAVAEIDGTTAGLSELHATAVGLGCDEAPFVEVARAVAMSQLAGLPLDPRRSIMAVARAAGVPV